MTVRCPDPPSPSYGVTWTETAKSPMRTGAAYRELAAAGLMAAGHSFVRGDEATYDLTREGFERKAELLALIGLKEAG